MSYRNYTDYRMNQAVKLPFADFVAPMTYVGDAVYMVVEAAARSAGQAFGAIKVKARERAAIKDLAALEDWALKDIGVRRSQIRTVARKVAANPGIDYRAVCRR